MLEVDRPTKQRRASSDAREYRYDAQKLDP